MTGYGRSKEILHGREISVDIKSVNNRYLDVNIKLPRIYSYAEEALKSRLQKTVSRGKVDVYITVGNAGAQDVEISINKPLLQAYLDAFASIEKEYGLKNDLTVSGASRLPDVLIAKKAEEDAEEVVADLLQVMEAALEDYEKMRLREGEALAADIRARAKTVEEITSRIEERTEVTVSEYRARLTAKMEEVLQGAAIDSVRILQEAAIFADKVSVDEETVRLRSHLAQMETMLSGGGPIGRKLDFLLQELNREANTTGSKANDAVQASCVIELKAELEKIREQIQNIE
ncbi:MAG: YicC family protein [Oscillospiraceae bacterium]|nr:YicC family protein [Oscillospiraceae bacterium]